ncbi:MAG: hypothetical protein Q4D56_02665 [Bacteroides sp.]|nr:hypothetical protein [Bacteroides sp.]
MKKNKLSWLFLSLMMTALSLGMSACSDDEETVPEFPTAQTISCSAGDTPTLAFTANMTWQLSSSALWCKFVSNGTEYTDLTGEAGTQSISLKITDDALNFTESTAKITLTMGGQSQEIATVTRAADTYDVTLLDGENELSTIAIGTTGDLTITVETNFKYALDLSSDKFTLIQVKGSENQYIIAVAEGYQKNPIAETEDVKLSILNENKDKIKEYAVTYTGMDPNSIKISGVNKWGWSVTMDGTDFSYTDPASQATVSVGNSVTYTVTALNDDYQFFYMLEGGGQYWYYAEGDEGLWLHATKDGENVTIKADAVSFASKGYVFAFPAAKYETVMASTNINKAIDESFIDTYQSNVIMEVSQKNASTGFTVRNGLTWETLDCQLYTGDYLEPFNSEYSVSAENIYQVTASAGSSLMAYPSLSATEWEGNAVAYDSSLQTIEGILEPSYDETGMMYLQISIPSTQEGFMFVVFRGTDYLNKKILFINIQ